MNVLRSACSTGVEAGDLWLLLLLVGVHLYGLDDLDGLGIGCRCLDRFAPLSDYIDPASSASLASWRRIIIGWGKVCVISVRGKVGVLNGPTILWPCKGQSRLRL